MQKVVNPKLFCKLIWVRLLVKQQITRLKDSEEKVMKTKEELRDELNTKLQNVFTVEDTLPPTLERWEERVTMEKVKILGQEIRILEDLNPYKACDNDEISHEVLMECAETHTKPLETLFKTLMEEGGNYSEQRVSL